MPNGHNQAILLEIPDFVRNSLIDQQNTENTQNRRSVTASN